MARAIQLYHNLLQLSSRNILKKQNHLIKNNHVSARHLNNANETIIRVSSHTTPTKKRTNTPYIPSPTRTVLLISFSILLSSSPLSARLMSSNTISLSGLLSQYSPLAQIYWFLVPNLPCHLGFPTSSTRYMPVICNWFNDLTHSC